MFLFMGLYDTDNNDNEEPQDEYEEPQEENEPVKRVIKVKNSKAKDTKLSKNFEIPEIVSKIGMYVGIGILILALIFLVYFLVKPDIIKLKLNGPSYLIYDYAETTLNVEIKNTFDYSLQDLTLKVKPNDSDSIAVMPSEDIKIQIIGIDESRKLSYKIGTIGNVNPGKYRIDVELLTPQEIITEHIFWEIKDRE